MKTPTARPTGRSSSRDAAKCCDILSAVGLRRIASEAVPIALSQGWVMLVHPTAGADVDLTDQAIAEFAERLVPEAFNMASTAACVEILPVPESDWMGEWVSSCIRDAVAARDLAGELLGAVIFVQNGDQRWRWDPPHPRWSVEFVVEKIRTELSAFPEPCVFVASMADRPRQQLWAGLRGLGGEPGWTMPWYAEERSRRRADVMTGIAEVTGSSPPRPLADREVRSLERAARRLLVGHPSRRRHRLR